MAISDTLNEEPSYVIDSNPKSLVDKFMKVLIERHEKIVEDVKKKYSRPIDFNMLPKKVQDEWLEREYQVSVFGFNSGKYDLPLILEWLVASVTENKYDKVFVAEKEGNYIFISTHRCLSFWISGSIFLLCLILTSGSSQLIVV